MKAKKYLGQNFLNSNTVAHEMVVAANINEDDLVVEVGPGTGFLTKEILDSAGKVLAIEKDEELIPRLKAQFAPGT
ncbi:MAG: 16S rRNA (adenine(1518)-N(6)/adenine(1519)-N(6))-dimethyltransferase, partial [Candidatus Omnitrophica bacterium]|nr:16S rRNA (adenine(1518)-N(6)/adenine(1519)-N(6))-dimethyltransferase [Candidatus Omnitrophota bacterium]